MSGFGLDDLKDCIKTMYSTYIRVVTDHTYNLKAVREKYTLDKYLQVATIKPPPILL